MQAFSLLFLPENLSEFRAAREWLISFPENRFRCIYTLHDQAELGPGNLNMAFVSAYLFKCAFLQSLGIKYESVFIPSQDFDLIMASWKEDEGITRGGRRWHLILYDSIQTIDAITHVTGAGVDVIVNLIGQREHGTSPFCIANICSKTSAGRLAICTVRPDGLVICTSDIETMPCMMQGCWEMEMNPVFDLWLGNVFEGWISPVAIFLRFQYLSPS